MSAHGALASMPSNVTLGAQRPWFQGMVWQSAAIIALHCLDAITTVWALSWGAVELNGIARFLLAAGPEAFFAAKLLFAGWIVIGLAWIHREWSARCARVGAGTTIALMLVVVAWNSAMLVILA